MKEQSSRGWILPRETDMALERTGLPEGEVPKTGCRAV